MTEPVNMFGWRAGRLTVVGLAGSEQSGLVWECKCDCGNTLNVRGAALRRKDRRATRSCGCLHSPYVRRHLAKELPK